MEYPGRQKGYKCYRLGTNGRYFVSMDVASFESTSFYSLEGYKRFKWSEEASLLAFDVLVSICSR